MVIFHPQNISNQRAKEVGAQGEFRRPIRTTVSLLNAWRAGAGCEHTLLARVQERVTDNRNDYIPN